VALLKELGAPLHIETLIEMESLFNDGTAMVFFSIFYDISQGKSVTAGSGVT
jgi:CPA1 family monovalent cation:H+ antiporter